MKPSSIVRVSSEPNASSGARSWKAINSAAAASLKDLAFAPAPLQIWHRQYAPFFRPSFLPSFRSAETTDFTIGRWKVLTARVGLHSRNRPIKILFSAVEPRYRFTSSQDRAGAGGDGFIDAATYDVGWRWRKKKRIRTGIWPSLSMQKVGTLQRQFVP